MFKRSQIDISRPDYYKPLPRCLGNFFKGPAMRVWKSSRDEGPKKACLLYKYEQLYPTYVASIQKWIYDRSYTTAIIMVLKFSLNSIDYHSIQCASQTSWVRLLLYTNKSSTRAVSRTTALIYIKKSTSVTPKWPSRCKVARVIFHNLLLNKWRQ